MEVATLIKYIIILVSVLGFLVILYILPLRKKEKKKQVQASKKSEDIPTLNYLSSIVNNSRTTSEQLSDTLALVIKHYGMIHPKLGVRSHPDADIYMFLILRLCRHPNTNKNLIVGFTNKLEKLNEGYKREINDALLKGLNSRGR